jgi:diadenosine tetraphosphate (Ap4A) HIT family hydrolase
MSTLIHERVEMARAGKNATVICQVPSGWAVLGDVQFLRGYSLLLPDPVVFDLNTLSAFDRSVFLRDMAIIGDALLDITDAMRINYDILGNGEPALHAHIFPRYADETDTLRRGPAFYYDWDNAPKFDAERDKELMDMLAVSIQKRLSDKVVSR